MAIADTTPTASLSRDGYKFILNVSKWATNAEHIVVKKTVYNGNGNEISKYSITETKSVSGWKSGSSKTFSWTMDKDKFYPFKEDGHKISKVVYKVRVYRTVDGDKRYSKWCTKAYKFKTPPNPTLSLTFDETGNNNGACKFEGEIDINEDYSSSSDEHGICTRVKYWVNEKEKGSSSEKIVKNTWISHDKDKNLTGKINHTIAPDKPVKYTLKAYGAGPRGRNPDTKSVEHIFAIPKPPGKPTITCTKTSCLYKVKWTIDTDSGWRPVDKTDIEYTDVSELYAVSQNTASWSTAKTNIATTIRDIQTDDIGGIADDECRYFRVKAYHDLNTNYSPVSDIAAYGRPSDISWKSVSSTTLNGANVIQLEWTNSSNKLAYELNNDGTRKYIDKSIRPRLFIYKNTISGTPIRTIYFGDSEWTDAGSSGSCTIPVDGKVISEGETVKFVGVVHVGNNNLNPGAVSLGVYSDEVAIPTVCKNLVASKWPDNTVVDLTWENPTSSDTLANGVEVAWSTFYHAFESNEAPETVLFENGTLTHCYITGLTEGEKYYFWVRCYTTDSNGNYTYGQWSDISKDENGNEGILLADEPNIPILTLSRTWVKVNGNIQCQWEYSASGNLPMSSSTLQIISVDSYGNNGSFYTLKTTEAEDNTVSVDFSDFTTSADSGAIEPMFPAGDYYMQVIVFNDVGSATSDLVRLSVVTEPSCSLSCSSLSEYTYNAENIDDGTISSETANAVTTLPITFTASGDGDLSIYIYVAENFDWQHPDKAERLRVGDCIYSMELDESGTYTIDDVLMADNCRYKLQLECVDPNTGLRAEAQSVEFVVHWSHQAEAPAECTVIFDDNNVATITPVASSTVSSDDVWDVYRLTPDGCYKCAVNVPWGASVIDSLPSFGKHATTGYRVVTRTIYGDEDWLDTEHMIDDSGTIIDYLEGTVHLPWNVTFDDSRSKSGEVRTHLGGSIAYFDQGYISHTESVSAEIVKGENQELVERLYELSRHNGVCYIRNSRGIGYPGVVEVSINEEYNNKIVSVSIDTTETDDIDLFLGEIE